MELVGGGSVINGAYPVLFLFFRVHFFHWYSGMMQLTADNSVTMKPVRVHEMTIDQQDDNHNWSDDDDDSGSDLTLNMRPVKVPEMQDFASSGMAESSSATKSTHCYISHHKLPAALHCTELDITCKGH